MANESETHLKNLLENKEAHLKRILVLFKSYIIYNKRNAEADGRLEHLRITKSIEDVLNKGDDDELDFICKSIQPKSVKKKSPKRSISHSKSLETIKTEPDGPNTEIYKSIANSKHDQIVEINNNSSETNGTNLNGIPPSCDNNSKGSDSSHPEPSEQITTCTNEREPDLHAPPEDESLIILSDSPKSAKEPNQLEIIERAELAKYYSEEITNETQETNLNNTDEDLDQSLFQAQSNSHLESFNEIGNSSNMESSTDSLNSSFQNHSVSMDENNKFIIKDCYISLESKDLIMSNYRLKRSRKQDEGDSSNNKNTKVKKVNHKNQSECSRNIDSDEKFEDFSFIKRRLTDPKVGLEIILEKVIMEVLTKTETDLFSKPVSSREVPDYYKIVKNPMDLTLIRDRIKEFHYKTRSEFLADIELLHSNSVLYNGACHIITFYAEKIVEVCKNKIEEFDIELNKLEKLINPLLDENPINRLNYILRLVLEDNVLRVKKATAFWEPVNPKTYPDYYELISNPIDLAQITKNLNKKVYKSKESFIKDFTLLKENCVQYNGEKSSYTKIAKKLVEACKHGCNIEHRNIIENLENEIESG